MSDTPLRIQSLTNAPKIDNLLFDGGIYPHNEKKGCFNCLRFLPFPVSLGATRLL